MGGALIQSGDKRPITSALNNLQGVFFTDNNLIAAGAMLAALPTLHRLRGAPAALHQRPDTGGEQGMSGIRLEDVTKRYPNGVKAVDDVSLDIADGEFMVLVGPSGCGKTTLLRTIAGLEDVTAGTIWIGDNDVTEKPAAAARHRDGVPELRALPAHDRWPTTSPTASSCGKMDKGERDAQVRDIAGKLGLDELLDRKPSALSGGQRQRVAMGRAIVREPKAFLMDEPLSNLDAKLRVSMRAELARLHERLGVTTVYVTHDQVEAMTLGERVAVMRDGMLQQVDTPQNLFNTPRNLFVAAFIGSPAMNLVEAKIDGGARALRRHRPAAARRIAAGGRAAAGDPRPAAVRLRARRRRRPRLAAHPRASPTWSSSSAPSRC